MKLSLVSALLLAFVLIPHAGVFRTVEVSESGAIVALTADFPGETTGVIITEVLPEGYSISSANPAYSKSNGNEYRWILYAGQLENGAVVYSVPGARTDFTPTGTWVTLNDRGAIADRIVESTPAVQQTSVPVSQEVEETPSAPSSDVHPYVLLLIGAIIVLALFVLWERSRKHL